MNKQELKELVTLCRESGKKTAVYFCSHVPQEILEAAGIFSLRIPYTSGLSDSAAKLLPRNVCPMVKNCCDICESDALDEVDLIIGETSCDGKKKMYELISRQDQLYFYQVAQGSDRAYVKPLIYSESKYLVRELQRRFDVQITEEEIRTAGALVNQERESIMALMGVQKTLPPAAWGTEIFETLEHNRMLPEISDRISANNRAREEILARNTPVPNAARRILLTGCPLSGIYQKVLSAVEENGGVVVCFENCEVAKAAVRTFDTETEDVYQALADCYQNTGCALMAPNQLRFDLVKRLIAEYEVDGVLDVTLQTCHPYTVERYKMMRYCQEELNVPYMSLETDAGDADRGQLTTRVSAFIEML